MEIVVVKLMEAPNYYAPPQQHDDDWSPSSVGFPLGTVLLLVGVIIASGIFSCCYHWDKLRHLRGDLSGNHHPRQYSPSKPKPIYLDDKRDDDRSLPVIMAGDQFPRFIAMPCPCKPPSEGKFAGELEMQTSPKPPHVVIPMD